MADLDRKGTNNMGDSNQQTNGNYTSQNKNVDSVNINNYDSNDYQPYLHDDSTQSSNSYDQSTQLNKSTASSINNQTQQNVGLDRSQLNNFNANDYQTETMMDSDQPVAPLTDGFQAEDSQSDNFREETAAEIAAPVTVNRREVRTEDTAGEGGGVLGLSALALSILSLFVFPVLFGAAGIILGFIARSRGAASGTWAITVGAISLILGIFVLPFF